MCKEGDWWHVDKEIYLAQVVEWRREYALKQQERIERQAPVGDVSATR